MAGETGLRLDGLKNTVPAMKIKAIIHAAEEGGYWAEVPALPGCVTQGESLAEVQANLREAITLWLEAGEPEPVSEGVGQVVEIAV